MTKFQIRDVNSGDIIDKDLSYQAALMYTDNAVGKYYVMEAMKESDDS